ncbi:MAG: hypothetical protein ACFBSC_07025 [Microcoleaceae cyanobacterium]
MMLAICPGIHDPDLTEDFLHGLGKRNLDQLSLITISTEKYPAYSGFDIFNFLQQEIPVDSGRQLCLIGFSAGVVGAITAAYLWQQSFGTVRGLIAIDGWGVPRLDWLTATGNFPIYRLSHDHFTHWSSSLLGKGDESFYADPAMTHLEIWRSPQATRGWWLHRNQQGLETATPALATDVILEWLFRMANSCNVSNADGV